MSKFAFGKLIDISAAAAILIALYFAFIFAPVEAKMGAIQKIFYFHVASAWVGFFALFVTFIASILFLKKRDSASDYVAAASAEIGLLFCTIVIITGPLWAKPVWGAYWSWDPRLTTTLVLWFIYAGYILLRKFVAETERRRLYCAVLGIIGFVDVPIVFFSIRWWRTIHPNVLQKGGGGLHPHMLTALLVSVAAFTILYAALMNKRIRLFKLEARYAQDNDETNG
ncbi:MAG: cytochrome c biogenesis protein CcsA [Deferribacteraceae bacterium]|jgi:heme exporter protein C|nr:cytochrome c biogenesis protein CcsA [Deferribacteraceae bacterium]